MRALVCPEYGPPSSLVLEERPAPRPGKGEVRVEIRAAGINFPDLLSIAGQYQVKTPLPFIPGHEAAGIIMELGEGAHRYSVGDRVIITTDGGAFAEQCAVTESSCMPLPAELCFEQGAGFTVTYGTACHALVQCARIQPGETILVLGAAGGVGIAAVELAKAFGARVIAAAGSDAKLDFARSAGADEAINYSRESLKDRIREITGGNGIDVVYDPVGGELATQAYRALAWHGRYLVIGFASGNIPQFPLNIALLKEASIIGVWWGTWAEKHPGDAARNMADLTGMIAAGRLKPRVTETYTLERYVEAFRSLSERRALGKVVFSLNP
jgi:NADPH2:quinone reductase